MRDEATAQALPCGWIRDRWFDGGFVLGTALLGLLSAAAVVAEPSLFYPILMADLWLLGYHHVVASYTRLFFDRESFRQHRFLVMGLPFVVFAGVVVAGAGIGLWVLATTYFYWQWFHYARQSWGVAQIYRRQAPVAPRDNDILLKVTFYAVPLWGILHRSHQDPGTFLGIELRVLPVEGWMVNAVAAVMVLALGWWVVQRVIDLWRGTLAVAYTLYMTSHFGMFAAGYVLFDSIDVGWLAVNIWHNAQYLVVVWLYNNNRFKQGVDGKARFLSFISQSRNVWLYLAVCAGISTAMYLLLENTLALLIAPIVIYQTINFHHYIVDSIIWKVRNKTTRERLGVTN